MTISKILCTFLVIGIIGSGDLYAAENICPVSGNWVLLSFQCHAGFSFRARFLACEGSKAMSEDMVDARTIDLRRRVADTFECARPTLWSMRGVRTYHTYLHRDNLAAGTWCLGPDDCTDSPVLITREGPAFHVLEAQEAVVQAPK